MVGGAGGGGGLTKSVEFTGISDDSGDQGDFITNDNDGITITAELSSALIAGEVLQYSTNGVDWVDIPSTSIVGTRVTHEDANLKSTTTVQMRVQNSAGQTGPVAEQLITIDTVAPAPLDPEDDPTKPIPLGKTSITIDDVTEDNLISADEGKADVTITGTVRGEFKSGDEVTLKVHNSTLSGNVDGNGVFTIKVKGADLLADVNKTITASVAATDKAGNVNMIDNDNDNDITTDKTYLAPITKFDGATLANKNSAGVQIGHAKVTDTDDVITYTVEFNEVIQINLVANGVLADVKLNLVIGSQTREATASSLSEDKKSITFKYTVVDEDFDHDGVKSGDLILNNGATITSTTIGDSTIASSISLTTANDRPLVDAINNGSLLLISAQFDDGKWYYFRDQDMSGTANLEDRRQDARSSHPTEDGFAITPFSSDLQLPNGIKDWNIPGWSDLRGNGVGVDDRNVWVGNNSTANTLFNVGTSESITTPPGSFGYYFYQVI